MFVREESQDQRYRHSHSALYHTLTQPRQECSKDTFLFIVVISKTSSLHHREVYRQTVLYSIVSNCLKDIKYVFLIGKPRHREQQQRIEAESIRYGDILQGNFSDTYDQLSVKSLFYLQWAALNCPQASYLFKLDDDVFTILEHIRFYLKIQQFPRLFIAGSVFYNVTPIKDVTNKWHVTNYEGQFFPTYVSCTAYVLSTSLLEPLFKEAMNLTLIRLEDVFVTGIVAKATNLDIEYHEFPGFGFENGGTNLAKLEFRVAKTVHGLSSEQLEFLYKKLLQEISIVCD